MAGEFSSSLGDSRIRQRCNPGRAKRSSKWILHSDAEVLLPGVRIFRPYLLATSALRCGNDKAVVETQAVTVPHFHSPPDHSCVWRDGANRPERIEDSDEIRWRYGRRNLVKHGRGELT